MDQRLPCYTFSLTISSIRSIPAGMYQIRIQSKGTGTESKCMSMKQQLSDNERSQSKWDEAHNEEDQLKWNLNWKPELPKGLNPWCQWGPPPWACSSGSKGSSPLSNFCLISGRRTIIKWGQATWRNRGGVGDLSSPGSVRTSLAAAISMNIFSALAFSSSLNWSGCHCAANLRYAFSISLLRAFLQRRITELRMMLLGLLEHIQPQEMDSPFNT